MEFQKISSAAVGGVLMCVAILISIISWHVGFNNGVDTHPKPEIKIVKETCFETYGPDGRRSNYGSCY